jgi:hypothetical protein
MLRTIHDENYWTLNIQDKVALHLPNNFGHGMYDMIYEFMKTSPIFKSPHVWNLKDDRNDIYKLGEHTLKDMINLNYNSMFQDIEKYNHIYNVWCNIDKS